MSAAFDIFKSVLTLSPDLFSLVQSALAGNPDSMRRIVDILDEVSASQHALERLQASDTERPQ